jgi:hypothetical protein
MSDSILSIIPIVWGRVISLKLRLNDLKDHKEYGYSVPGISARFAGAVARSLHDKVRSSQHTNGV